MNSLQQTTSTASLTVSTPTIEVPVTAAQLAPLIGIHRVTLLKWASEGRVPCRRLSPRKILFLPSEINRWLASDSNLYSESVGHAA